MTGLVTFCIALIFDNRKRSAREREKAQERFDKQDDSLALINQALAVLVSQISPVIVKLAEVDARLSALDVSAGVLRAALDNHLAASAVWEKRLIDQFASMSRDQDRMQRYQEGNGHG
jgi:septal ring factor EnvC (AmiA/AmiB activator)